MIYVTAAVTANTAAVTAVIAAVTAVTTAVTAERLREIIGMQG